MFTEFIKHYDIIRNILRDIFLYGCFSREDYEGKKRGSSRKIDYEIRRIQQYIEKEFIKWERDGRNKLISLSYDSITNTENFLVNTYLSKSFTRMDITLYYGILLVLNYAGRDISFNDIEQMLADHGLVDYEEVSSKTIERKLKELSEEIGLVSCKKSGRCKVYGVEKDILEELNKDEIKRLYILIGMYRNILFPNIAGYYFYDTLKQYMEFEREMEVCDAEIFQYYKLHFHPVIEEEVLWKLMKSVARKNRVIIQYNEKENRHSRFNNQQIIPYKIRYDVECGRFYLVAFHGTRCMLARLDRIKDITVLNEHYNEDGLREKYDFSMKNSWSSVQINGKTKAEFLKIRVNIDNEGDMYLVNRIKGELKNCTVVEEEKNTFVFTRYVNDCYEMIPWIRGYGGKVQVIEPRYIRKKINTDWQEMLKNYGVISRV